MKNTLLKRVATLLMLVSILNVSLAQQPNNGGFENWDNVGSNTEEPTNWSGMMTGNLCGFCGFGASQRVFRDGTDKHSGNYSARIESTSASGVLVNGTITTGQVNAPSITPSEGYNMTLRSNANFRHAFASRPDSVVFWAKYNITNNTDSARVSVVIHGDYDVREPQDGASQPFIVAKTVKNFQTGGDWVRISLPINYTGPSSDVQYLLATFTSSYVAGQGNNSAKLWVDDMEFIYNPNTALITPSAAQNILVNTSGFLLTVSEVANAASFEATITREWKYSTTSGSGYQSFATAQTGTTYTPLFTEEGTYYVICETYFDAEVVLSNEVTINVYEEVPNVAAIAPTAVQNIEVNQAGTTLTVTETPSAAGSREWKFSTTSGSGYMSFPSDEFGLTYTPLFTTAGTYYVVCESDFNGEFVVSNEVQINVSPSTGGLNEELIQVVLFQKDNQLVVDLTSAAIENPVFQLISMDGKTVANVKMNAMTSNLVQIDFAPGVYIYQLSNGQTRVDGKIMIK